MTKKVKITFIVPSLTAGGAQRIMSYVAQRLNKNKFTVTFLVIGFKKDNAYEITGIEEIYLNKTRIIHSIFNLIKILKKTKPDIVVTSLAHVNTLMAFICVFFPRIKFIARVANVLSVLKNYDTTSKIYFPKFLKVLAYKLTDNLICQSDDMQRDIIVNFSVPKNKITLINNPISQNFKIKPILERNSEPLKFITIARLSKQKGHERIIQLLSKLDFPFVYTIIGGGDQKENIFNLIDKKQLNPRINYVEYTKEIEYYLSKNDIFLQGSYVEGLPNAVIESCAVGTPVIAFNAPGGINEIIQNGVNGYVANNEEEFIEFLENENKAFTFNPKTVNNCVSQKFNSEKIIAKYEALFIDIILN